MVNGGEFEPAWTGLLDRLISVRSPVGFHYARPRNSRIVDLRSVVTTYVAWKVDSIRYSHWDDVYGMVDSIIREINSPSPKMHR